MQERIEKYIEEKIKGLKSGEEVTLKGVFPSVIEDVIGDFEDELELNGWQGDYWTGNSEYKVSGCMYYGDATITKK